MFDVRHALYAYWRARGIKSKARLDAVAKARMKRWLRTKVPQVPFYANRKFNDLSDLPVVDKAELMSDFAAFNRAGITADAAWNAFAGTKKIGDLVVGASTGTSGNRGLFVISQKERFRWLGTILAKALPGFWRQRHRVAVLLPLNTPLYDSANRFSQLSMRFFDLSTDWAGPPCRYDPTVIIAPPKVLRQVAERQLAVSPAIIFAGAETLDPVDRDVIEQSFGVVLRQIYMATEGLFAVSCAQGTLHLCEDTMHFELPQAGDDPDLREVIISDFSRDTQLMARYRMNDLIRLGSPCACGLPHQTLKEVVGRADDCFIFENGMITPDLLRNAVVDADRCVTDYRICQTGPAEVVVTLPVGADVDAVGDAVRSVLQSKNLSAKVVVTVGTLTAPMDRKLRRVERQWHGQVS